MDQDAIEEHAEKVLNVLMTGHVPGTTLAEIMQSLESVVAAAVMICAIEGHEDILLSKVTAGAQFKIKRLQSSPDLIVMLREIAPDNSGGGSKQ